MIGTLRAALSTFTVLPVGRADVGDGAALVLWLPLVGALVGAGGGAVAAAALGLNPGAGLLAAVLAVAALALLTRGLHLDGLADTADGLGSRAPAEQALQIMRRSDIGPFGVVSIVVALGVDVAALLVFTGASHHTQATHASWHPLAALVVAATAGRVAAVQASTPGVRAARPGGFGALVAGTTRPWVVVLETLLVLALAGALGAAVGADPWTWVAGTAFGLAVTFAFRLHVVRRLGGVTGDVFGALIEIGTATTLLALALAT